MPKPEADLALYFDYHVFVCTNTRDRDDLRGSCDGGRLRDHMKVRTKELGLTGVRINSAGCMARCEKGPTLVVYPEGVWYGPKTTEDIDEILTRHIQHGERVDRLLLEQSDSVPTTGLKATPERRLRLRVRRLETLTANIRQFELTAEDGGPLPPFTAGAHIDLFTSTGLRRSYSLVNDPDERNRYLIAVLHECSGGGSAWLHNTVAVDDIIEATAPKNLFELDEDAPEAVMIAGGIGITPILAMGRRLRRLGRPATLHYCARGPETTAYADEVKRVFDNRVTFHHDGGDPSRGIDLERVLAERPCDAALYICGPAGLIDAGCAAAAHWPKHAVHFERFKPLNTGTKGDDNPFDIVLSRQERTLTVPAGRSILEILRNAGIDVESSCEKGVCGTCRVGLLAGKVDHRESVLDDEATNHSSILACLSRAEPGEILVLDL